MSGKVEFSITLAAPIALMLRQLIEVGLPWSSTPKRVAHNLAQRGTLVLTARESTSLAAFAIMQFGEGRAHLSLLAGCPHREDEPKTYVRIIDFVDAVHPAMLRMWNKRQREYRTLGYRIANSREHQQLSFASKLVTKATA